MGGQYDPNVTNKQTDVFIFSTSLNYSKLFILTVWMDNCEWVGLTCKYGEAKWQFPKNRKFYDDYDVTDKLLLYHNF